MKSSDPREIGAVMPFLRQRGQGDLDSSPGFPNSVHELSMVLWGKRKKEFVLTNYDKNITDRISIFKVQFPIRRR